MPILAVVTTAACNRLFALDGTAFTITSDEAEGVVEQIDGVIDLDGELYLAEMKWLRDPVGVGDLGSHFSRVMFRGTARGLFVSASGFTAPAIAETKTALARATFVLCELEEIVLLLGRRRTSATTSARRYAPRSPNSDHFPHRPSNRVLVGDGRPSCRSGVRPGQ